jgi:prepilin-type N-terminal cleavage/methylation domain-containing protein
MAAPTRVKGFTLIELLISITVLSMVIGISTFAFSLFSKNWQGVRTDFDLAAGQLQRLELLYGAVRDAAAWLVVSDERRQSFGFYFLGRDEGMTFVTASPVFDSRGVAVVRVFREREENARTWRLVYEEAPLKGMLLREASQTLPFQHRLVILRGLPEMEFRYFGWRSLSERTAGIETGLLAPEWFDEYDGIVRQQQPIRIAMRTGGDEIFFDVAERDDIALGRARERE